MTSAVDIALYLSAGDQLQAFIEDVEQREAACLGRAAGVDHRPHRAAVARTSGTRGFAPDPARGRHERGVAGRLVGLLLHGRDAVAQRVSEAAGDLSLEEAGAVSLRSDPTEAAAARARLTLDEARFAELYLLAGRS